MHLLQIDDLSAGRLPKHIRWEDTPEARTGKAPEYAILSHRWQAKEVLFDDIVQSMSELHVGYKKLSGTIEQARRDRYKYLWVDSCCIDKRSSAELTEAINSMYNWYRDAKMCYVYLADVSKSPDNDGFDTEFMASQWFTRGWTLQELLAPNSIRFYSSRWDCIGDMISLSSLIAAQTTIPFEILVGQEEVYSASVATRMSWAAGRKTQRIEDGAYSLMGIFSVNMPLLYGEGPRAFIRLQEEIMRTTDDYSLFAWKKAVPSIDGHGLLADSAEDFRDSGGIRTYQEWTERAPYAMTNKGISIELGVYEVSGGSQLAATLPCSFVSNPNALLSINIRKLTLTGQSNQFVRSSDHLLSITPGLGMPQPMYFPQRHSEQDSRLSGFHRISLKLNTSSCGGGVWPVASLANLSPIPKQQASTLQILPSKERRNNTIEGVAYLPKWEPGLELAISFRVYDVYGGQERRFLLLLGTMVGGGVGFACTSDLSSWREDWHSAGQENSLNKSSQPRHEVELISYHGPFVPQRVGTMRKLDIVLTGGNRAPTISVKVVLQTSASQNFGLDVYEIIVIRQELPKLDEKGSKDKSPWKKLGGR